MKTLDEVIKACEETVSDVDRGVDIEGCYLGATETRDALHYLKELRDMTDIPMEYFENGGTSQKLRNTSQITCPKCHSEFVILPEANNALTWSELRQMEGKPVWIEGEHGCIWDQKSWVLIRLDNENEDLIICVATNNGHYEFAIGKEDYGKDWQAYRKERS